MYSNNIKSFQAHTFLKNDFLFLVDKMKIKTYFRSEKKVIFVNKNKQKVESRNKYSNIFVNKYWNSECKKVFQFIYSNT